MRITLKLIPALAMIAFAATSALADSVCYELCLSCHGASRPANCDKIESTCNCPFVIDSAKSKNTGIEFSKRKLIEEISAGCDRAACAREVTFENGFYKSIDKGRTTLTRFELLAGTSEATDRAKKMQPHAVHKANETVDSLMRKRSLLPIAPMSQECTERCNTCSQPAVPAVLPDDNPAHANSAPADTLAKASTLAPQVPTDSISPPADSAQITPIDSVALAKARTDSIAEADSLHKVMCKLTENTCQCKAHEDNTRAIEALDSVIAIKTAYADSMTKLAPTLLREEMARAIADSVQARCNVEGKCKYTITFTSKELALLEMHRTEEPAPDTTTKLVAVKTAEPAQAKASTDTAKAAPIETCPQVAEDTPKDTAEKKNSDRIFYKVMEFTYGNFGEHSYYEKDYGRIRNLDDETGYEGGLTYLLRWYFYDAGAISIGLGTFYHYKKFNYEDSLYIDSDISILYHNIGLDIPLSFRLGVPFIPIFKPYISQTFHFHKPIFEVYKYSGFEEEEEGDPSTTEEIESTAKSFLGLGFLDEVHTRFNGAKDLTFSVWLGFGLQITRHFSAEYQINFGTGSSGHAHRFDCDNYWRVVVDFAW